MNEFDPSQLFFVVDVAGVLGTALLGGAVARAHRFDLVGFAAIGIISGLGGGMMRDVLLDAGFPVFLTDPAYLTAALLGSAVAFFLDLRGRWTRAMLDLADVLALGCWAATGTAKALGFGLGWIPAVLLGLITAIGGGIIRDVLVGRVPAVFGGNPLYATVGLLGCLEMLVCFELGVPDLGMALSIVTCGALGILARRQGWILPGAVQWNLGLARLSRRAAWRVARGRTGDRRRRRRESDSPGG